MRAPLLVMIVVVAITMLGMVLIPGEDAAGKPYQMSFFEAFYFSSFMATTIGFGEIPYAFTNAQRLWVTICMYPSVMAWLYGFGTLLTLMQDDSLRQSMVQAAYARQVRRIKENFFLICGYGATGKLLVRSLVDANMRCVVIDASQQTINDLSMEDLPLEVPGLGADSSDAEHLVSAGLQYKQCTAVAAITYDDQANLKIAITSKLLHPDMRVIARADHQEIANHMAAFGTDHIIKPFVTFTSYFMMALMYPKRFCLQEMLVAGENPTDLVRHLQSTHGKPWIICGFGRLGREIYDSMCFYGMEPTVVDAFPSKNNVPSSALQGRGTDVDILMQAGLMQAGGIIVATDNDTDNLSILLAARRLNPELCTIARQVVRANDMLFAAAQVDMVMQANHIVARKAFAAMSTPLLDRFTTQLFLLDDTQTVQDLTQQVSLLIDEPHFRIWQFQLDEAEAPAVVSLLSKGAQLHLSDLLTNPWGDGNDLPVVPLMVKDGVNEYFLPAPDLALKYGMALLFCGCRTAQFRSILFQYEALASMNVH